MERWIARDLAVWYRRRPLCRRLRQQPPRRKLNHCVCVSLEITSWPAENCLRNSPVFSSIAAWRKTQMATILKCGRRLLPATCFAIVFAMGVCRMAAVVRDPASRWPDNPDSFGYRVHTPTAVATISPLLKGDVIITNFEATVLEKEQSTHDGRFPLPAKRLTRCSLRLQPGGPLPIIIPLI